MLKKISLFIMLFSSYLFASPMGDYFKKKKAGQVNYSGVETDMIVFGLVVIGIAIVIILISQSIKKNKKK